MKKNKIEFIGKSLLFDNSVLVIGDLHLGYEEALHNSGILVKADLYKQTIEDLEEIFSYIKKKNGKNASIKSSSDNYYIINKLGRKAENKNRGQFKNKKGLRDERVDKIIILGDLKHEFGSILREEWREVLDLVDYLNKKAKEIIVVKGNHDIFTDKIVKKKGINIVDYFIWRGFAFLHGDRDFKEIYNKKIKYWVVGHGHPAIVLEDKGGVKREKYKCFLIGKYRGKEIIVIPSFFPLIEGSDPRDFNLGLVWNFDLDKFRVKIIDDNLNVWEFGELSKI